jgi:hypothetical protein
MNHVTRTGFLLLLPLALGCSGQPTMRVWGEVRYNGNLVEEGEIAFVPQEGTAGPETGGPIHHGAYDVPAARGPLVGGTYKVRINGYAKTGRKIEAGPGAFVDAYDNLIPARYNTRTTLQVVISSTASENHHDFALEAQPADRKR